MRPTPLISRAPRSRSNYKQKRLWTLAILILIAAVLLSVIVSVYVGWQLTHPERKALTETPDRYGMTFEAVQFDSRTKDTSLKGWFLPSESLPAKLNIIIAHGYQDNRLQSNAEGLKLAKTFITQGYNVLMFDFRNSGESEGTTTTVGYLEKYDLLGAIDWMNTNHPGILAIHGFSMGATTALLAAAEEPTVAGIVADSPFNHLTHYLEENLPVWSHLPNMPFTPLILGILPPLTGIQTDKVDALNAIDSVYPRPILFIHSTDDHSVPYQNSEAMWAKHKDKFQFWNMSGVNHTRAHQSIPLDYEAKVIDFYNQLAL